MVLADHANIDVISIMTNIISFYPDRCGCQGGWSLLPWLIRILMLKTAHYLLNDFNVKKKWPHDIKPQMPN